MSRRSRKRTRRSIKSGLPPGSLVHVGEIREGDVKITVMDYDQNGGREEDLKDLDRCLLLRESPSVTWLNVESVQNGSVIQKIGDCFSIHPLVQEDIMNTHQRPKMEDYGEYLYIVIRALHGGDEMSQEQISLVLGKNYVISFQEGIKGDWFDPVRERIRGGKGKIRGMGPDYLAYSLIDAVVDGYFVMVEKLGEEIEVLEDEVVTSPTPEMVHRLNSLKRKVMMLRKAVWPLREEINFMLRAESTLISEPVKLYLRDVYDHTIQLIDSIETHRDLLAGMLDIYLSSLSNRMNEVMKFLTIIGTIFIPLTFIAGVYGMNFRHMPELEWNWGYYVSLLVMSCVAGAMLLYFRRKGWL